MKLPAGASKLFFPLFFISVCVFALWQISPKTRSSAQIGEKESVNYDIRTAKTEPAARMIGQFIEQSGRGAEALKSARQTTETAIETLRSRQALLKIEYNEDLQIPEVISTELKSVPTFLTAPATGRRADIFKAFLKENSALVGLSESQIDELKITADYTNPDGNLSFVHLAQTINGVPVFRGEIKAGFSRKNEIIRIINNLAPALAPETLSTDFGALEQIVSSAESYLESVPFKERTKAEKMFFPIAQGVARPAWRVLFETSSEMFYVIVDAATGTLLWRKNLTEHQTQASTYEVYGNTTSMMKTEDSPTPFTPGCPAPTNCPQPPIVPRQTFMLIGNEPPYNFNNLGWLPDGETRTVGNAAEVGIDRDGTNGVDPNGWAFGGANRNFVFAYNPAPGNPAPGEAPVVSPQTYPPIPFQQGSVTHAFYTANRWHDETYLLGFTEQALNFQTDNFGRGGTGNDSLSVEIQDSSGTNGANFATPADGARGRAQFFIWTGGDPDRDGALDSQVVVHELTHGLSNRLHGNASGLSTNMSRGMGEGWSDFYALALLSEPGDDPCGTYTIAGYSTYQIAVGFEGNYYYGIRRFPTARRQCVGPNGLPHNPVTFRYINSDCNTLIGTTTSNPPPNSAFPRGPIGTATCDQIHNMGEIWLQALWEVRGFLIEAHGAVEGNRRALQYITDGMKLAPINPTMLQERDAIIAATTATRPTDVIYVRRGFAVRGMGFFAGIQNAGTGANNTVVTESFDALGNVQHINPFLVNDSTGNNNGFPEPGENVLLNVAVTNTTGATVNNVQVNISGGPNVSYGNVADGQVVTRQIAYTVPLQVPCGGLHEVQVNVSSDNGTMSPVARQFRVGTPVGGSPVTFSNLTLMNIPAGRPATTSGPATPYSSDIAVSGLTGNKKIVVELTANNHTWGADLDILLEGPNGQKFIVMSDAFNSSNQTGTVTTTLTIRDDAATVMPATGVWPANGDFQPTNHTTGDTFVAPAPAGPYENSAPAGTATLASVFGSNSANLNGTWKLWVVDDASGDSGTMEAWKLTFESNDFICPDNFPKARADFDGDGKTDVSVFRPTDGVWYLNRSTAGFTAFNWGILTDRITPGDFDGDNRTDIAVFRPTADSSLPDFYVLNSSNSTFSGYSWGLSEDIPVINDYDGDGRDDVAIYRPGTHTFYVLNSLDASARTFSNISFGTPVTGDFDGDGRGDFATYSINGWFLAQSNINYATVNFIRFGADGDRPVPADYDGDGKDDLAVFRPSDQTWYIRKSSGGTEFIQFGRATDILVPGDYDGDAKTDIAVYRNGTWYLNRTTAGLLITQFGLTDDIPVPKGYLP